MIYPLLKPAQELTSKIQRWARIHRARLGILAEYRPNGEVRLISAAQPPLLSADNIAGCTLSVRDNSLIIACAEACAEIEKAVAEFLRKAKLIGQGRPSVQVEVFKRQNIRHAHEMGRLISEDAKAKRRERRELALSNRPPARFKTVLEATYAAVRESDGWLVLTERAIKTAGQSRYVDPDYVFKALLDLGKAAKHNAEHNGLGDSWANFLGRLGSHDFVPNSSPYTIKRHHDEYHVRHQGKDLCIEAHIRQGNGSADECLRIYVVQPRKPGDPVIIGQIGSHLPIDGRAH
jgi:hypothetical protein